MRNSNLTISRIKNKKIIGRSNRLLLSVVLRIVGILPIFFFLEINLRLFLSALPHLEHNLHLKANGIAVLFAFDLTFRHVLLRITELLLNLLLNQVGIGQMQPVDFDIFDFLYLKTRKSPQFALKLSLSLSKQL